MKVASKRNFLFVEKVPSGMADNLVGGMAENVDNGVGGVEDDGIIGEVCTESQIGAVGEGARSSGPWMVMKVVSMV